MADWEEIKRLAADFQRAQLSSTVQRLSERNCVEIVKKLQALNLIDLVYTTDGKEYLTPDEITKEIKEELEVHRGRIALGELQQAVGVDYSHVETRALEVVHRSRGVHLVLGQLVDESYLDNLAEEINDKLQEQGQVTIAEITKQYDLPADFLLEALQKRVGKIIKGHQDELERGLFFTEAFINRHRAMIRGAFSAVTQPVQLGTILNRYNLQEGKFYSILDELISSGRLAGSIAGGHQERAMYVPDIYTQGQNEWVDSFYSQNGYLEFDALTRLGINDPKGYTKRRLKAKDPLFLPSCCISKDILEQVEASVDEALTSTGWVDVVPLLPSVFNIGDCSQVLQHVLKAKSGVQVVCDTYVVSEKFLSSCATPFDSLLNKKAEQDVKSNPALLTSASNKGSFFDDGLYGKEERKDARKKKAAGASKSGGGTQGREVKSKSTKKKYLQSKHKDDDSDDESATASSSNRGNVIEFMSVEEIEEELQKSPSLEDCPEDFIREVATQLHRPLTRQYQEVLKSVFLQTVAGAPLANKKKTHSDLAEKVVGLWTNAKLFEKGINLFGDETQAHLQKHLLRTVCTDITNMIFSCVATENMISVAEDTQITQEIRVNMLSKVQDDKMKNCLTKLHSTLTGKTVEEYFEALDDACGPGKLEIILKKPDKKKERQLVFHHRQTLAEQLKEELDPAMALHLATVVLFTVFTQTLVHAPGRCVPQLIAFHKQHLPPENHQVLLDCQELVVKQLKVQSTKEEPDQSAEGDEDEESSQIKSQLSSLLPRVKEIVLTTKKSVGQVTED